MNCSDAIQRMLDAAEGSLGSDEERALTAHLEVCTQCRAEFSQVKAGLGILREALPTVAPRDRYLTPARREGVLSTEGGRIFRLATYRQFVAAAAAAAILVSLAFIGARMMGVRDAMRMRNAPVMAADRAAPFHRAPMTVFAPGGAEPIRASYSPGPALATGAPLPAAFTTDTPGVTVPVNHALYDPEESTHWW